MESREGVVGAVDALKGQRVGLVANATAVTKDYEHLLDVFLVNGVKVSALFGPEHGFYGDLDEKVASTTDPRTGLPVHSLYGDTRKPTPEMLEGLDTLVFSMQDVGVRFYTYISTMHHCMRAAAEAGLGFCVVDRPNPITGTRLEGNVSDGSRASFVGVRPLPVRHGMTIGELAGLFRGEDGIDVDLVVARVPEWRRAMWFDETGLPWVMPSPAMATPDTAMLYPGMCFLEGTNIGEGRGTSRPFELAGAPWIDAFALAEGMNARGVSGVRFRPTFFVPSLREYAGQPCAGVQIHVTDREAFEPVRTAMHLIAEIRERYPDKMRFAEARFDRLAGTDVTRLRLEKGDAPDDIVDAWSEELSRFEALRAKYLIYT